jgi:hypothetical protein
MASQAEDLAGANGASVETVYFENIDCTGASYAHVGTGSAFRGGTVGRQSSTSLLFYIPKNEPQVVIAPLSRNSGTGCVLGSGTAPGDKFMRALPNDPSVTGVLDEPAVGPLRLEMAEIAGSSFDLFRNGFEGAFAFRQTSSQFV